MTHQQANLKAQLSIHDLACVRDDRILFEGLNFSLEKGQLLHINGHNGSGKTSLLRILCGLSLAESGEIYWQGDPIDNQYDSYLNELNYIGHHPGIKADLSALENLQTARAMSSQPLLNIDLDEVLDTVGLYGFEDIPARQLSAGQKRRVALARLWVSSAKLWILDEPFTALDKKGIKMVEDKLLEHADNGGIAILTSHHLIDCDNLLHIHLSD